MSADLKELRIRNLLMYGDKLVEVSAIFRSHFNCESIDGISYGNSIQSNFEPIPLTKEWLLNFGFKVNRKTKEGNNIWRCNWTEGHFESRHNCPTKTVAARELLSGKA